jgi:predicted alpha/beta hydrolase family esterase
MTAQVLFIQGGGAGAHDDWDSKLVTSLRDLLGSGWEVRYPRMPSEDDPSYAAWGPAILHEISKLGDGAILVAHSIGAPILVNALAERAPDKPVAAIVLMAAPFVGDGGWAGEEFATPADLGAKLPEGVPVHLFHGEDDETAPPAHAELYARAIPQACLHRLPGRDHQFGNDLSEVAAVIKAVE